MRFYLIILLLICFNHQAFAIVSVGNIVKSNLPAILKANIVSGDQINQTIIAKGNVEISKGSSIIFADEVQYNKSSKIISGKGNILVKNLEIGKIYAPNFDIKDDFSSGNFYLAKIFFADGSFIFSDKISRHNPFKSSLKNSIFSICPNEEIANDNTKSNDFFDFIKIKSSLTTIDREVNYFSSKNTIFKIYEVPILYLPYFKFPLPATKRQSGLLQPSYTKNSNFGLGLNLPIFININRSTDLTISPTYYINSGQLIVNNDFHKKIKFGSYNLALELANNKVKKNNFDTTIINRSNKNVRWQLNGLGDFNFSKNFGVDYSVQTLSDRTYLRDYNFNYLAFTTSKINADYINNRNYFGIKSIKFQELENENLEKKSAFILPSINGVFETPPLFFKEKFILHSNFTSLRRIDGLQYNRGTLIPTFKIPFNIQGNLFELSTRFQGDLYTLNDKDLRKNNEIKIYNSVQSDNKRELSINWRLPIRNKSNLRTITIEPMANFVISDYKSKNSVIPLEDSIDTELTFSNLFANDRISGFDRNEAGKRLSYGLKSSIFNSLGEFNFTAGQAMIIKKSEQDIKIRGFAENNKSNIVGIASFKGKKYFSISYSFQLDQANYRNDVNQVFANFKYKKFEMSSDYLLIRKNINNLKEREQSTISSSIDIYNNWFVKAFLTRDFVEKRNIQRGIEITRKGCCSNFGFSIIERNPSSLTKPQKTFNINFTIKNL
jgi:LPS-assembly protein